MIHPPNPVMVPRKPYGVLTPQRLTEFSASHAAAVRRTADTRHESTKRWVKRDRLVAHSPERNTPDV